MFRREIELQPEGVEHQETEVQENRLKSTSYSQEACFKEEKDVRSSKTTGEARRPVRTDNDDRHRKITKDGKGRLNRTPNAARRSTKNKNRPMKREEIGPRQR